MQFIEVVSNIIDKYGISGFIIVATFVGSGWLVYKTFGHFINQVEKFQECLEKRDLLLASMADKFTDSISSINRSLGEISVVNKALSHDIENAANSFTTAVEKNNQDHNKILSFLTYKKQQK